MAGDAEAVGSRRTALANARALLPVDPSKAVEQAQLILDSDKDCALSHYVLALALRRLDKNDQADTAARRAIEVGQFEPAVANAIVQLAQRDFAAAEVGLRAHLGAFGDDAWALYLLAEIALSAGQAETAHRFVRRALQICPEFGHALSLLQALQRADAARGALSQLDEERFLRMAIDLYRAGVEENPGRAEAWLVYGNFLRMAGKRDHAIDALRRAIQIDPKCGEAWWALADFKTVAFSEADLTAMAAALDDPELASADREALQFAMGRAHEMRGEAEAAFQHYQAGNETSKVRHAADDNRLRPFVAACLTTFTPDYFAARAGVGCADPDPIFIVGMPRAGSTLLEQILASHSQVEGTSELPDLEQVVAHLELSAGPLDERRYLSELQRLSAIELDRLGKGYLWASRIRRQTAKPRFIDKMPNNWQHVGLIMTILPNARIIDARRHPLACGWSNYRQRFLRGQDFSNSLASIGDYYRFYTELMDHFDSVQPGRVHRLYHEALLEDVEREVRRLLDFCGLPFEDQCLKFHEAKRAVRTSSSEQVRQPLNRAGTDQWRQFRPYLDPLITALGPVLPAYPFPE